MATDREVIEALHGDIARYRARIEQLESNITKWAYEIQAQATILNNEVTKQRRRILKALPDERRRTH